MTKKDINKEKFSQRLEKIIEENNETIYSIAEILDLSPSTISRYVNKNMSPKITTIKILAQHFNINPVWLMGYDVPKKLNNDLNNNIKEIPVLGSIAAGQPIFAEENIKSYEKVPAIQVRDGQYFYLKVSGDSMINAGIHEGDLVLVKKQCRVENKDIAVVRVNAHDATVKRVYVSDGNYILQPENPNYEPIMIKSEDARIIGKVVALTRKFK